MYAIFENGSKQYKVSVGDTVKVEKLAAQVGSTVSFPVVLTADEKGIQVGKEVENVKVSAEVLSQGKEKKIIVFKYKAKKNERKKQGHRQPYTAIKITAIGDVKTAAKKSVAKSEAAETEPKAAETKAVKAAAPKKTTKAAEPKAAETKAEAKTTAAKKPAAKKTAEKTAE